MKLWYSAASPFVRKVMILANETGLSERIELVDVATTHLSSDPKLIETNPLGKIPSMVLEDGHCIFDSRVICEYLDGLHDGDRMLPSEGTDRLNVLVAQSIGDGIMEAAVAVRYEQAFRPEDKQWQDWMDGHFEKISRALNTLESWRGGRLNDIHLGSISVVSALAYLDFRHPEFDWRANHPLLTQMHATFSKRESMIKTAPE